MTYLLLTYSAQNNSVQKRQAEEMALKKASNEATHMFRVLHLNNSYMGEAVFDCPFGYQLVGKTFNVSCIFVVVHSLTNSSLQKYILIFTFLSFRNNNYNYNYTLYV